MDVIQKLQQQLRLHHQGVAIGEEHPPHHRPVVRPALVQIPHDLLFFPYPELLLPVHVAEGTPVMGAPDGDLDNEASGLAGGSV